MLSSKLNSTLGMDVMSHAIFCLALLKANTVSHVQKNHPTDKKDAVKALEYMKRHDITFAIK